MESIAETERLMLREITVDDAEEAYALNLDPEVLKYTGDEPFKDQEEARSFLASYSQYKDYGFGRWAVIRKSDNAFLGWCGLKYDAQDQETDIGFRLFRKYWNQGYATEAAEKCLELAFERFNKEAVVAHCIANNAGSCKVLQKIGMLKAGTILRENEEWQQFVLNKSRWTAMKRMSI